jgi:sigma-B regulation protein RsbU (phosphoserine phosphatase)
MNILITDDEATSRLMLEATLRKLGHEVVVTENGGQAWEAFQQEYFPVLISDWLMPHLDGLTLCRMIRERMQSNYTYIILLTVLEGKANYLEAMEAGVDDFITKPFDAEELAARLRVAERILGLRRHVKQLEGLLSICAYCKRIREQGAWYQLEDYISRHSEVKFSHTYCPDCYDKFIKPEMEPLGGQ